MGSIIYFDNGATTFPKPVRVEHAVIGALRKYGANPGRSGHSMSIDTAVKVYECREAAAAMFGAESPENVVFTPNCTVAINLAVKGLLKQGDHVIISDIEHNSVLRPVHKLASRGIITYSVAQIYEGDDEATLNSFRTLMKPNTRLVACSHGSNVWGIIAPISKIGEMAREKNAFFLVDAAQTAGVVKVDMQKQNIDFLCIAGHKSLYGPPGTGMLITAIGKNLDTIIEGGSGTFSASYIQPEEMPERLESGTVNTMGIIGLNAGINYVCQKGIDRIYSHEMRLSEIIYAGLSANKNIELYTKAFEKGIYLPVISFNIKGEASEEVASKLSDMGFALRGGLHCSPLAHKKMGTTDTGAVRISVGAFNTAAQVNELCRAIERISYSA